MIHHLAYRAYGFFLVLTELATQRLRINDNLVSTNEDGELTINGNPVGGSAGDIGVTPLEANCILVNNTSTFANGQDLISFGSRPSPFEKGFHLKYLQRRQELYGSNLRFVPPILLLENKEEGTPTFEDAVIASKILQVGTASDDNIGYFRELFQGDGRFDNRRFTLTSTETSNLVNGSKVFYQHPVINFGGYQLRKDVADDALENEGKFTWNARELLLHHLSRDELGFVKDGGNPKLILCKEEAYTEGPRLTVMADAIAHEGKSFQGQDTSVGFKFFTNKMTPIVNDILNADPNGTQLGLRRIISDASHGVVGDGFNVASTVPENLVYLDYYNGDLPSGKLRTLGSVMTRNFVGITHEDHTVTGIQPREFRLSRHFGEMQPPTGPDDNTGPYCTFIVHAPEEDDDTWSKRPTYSAEIGLRKYLFPGGDFRQKSQSLHLFFINADNNGEQTFNGALYCAGSDQRYPYIDDRATLTLRDITKRITDSNPGGEYNGRYHAGLNPSNMDLDGSLEFKHLRSDELEHLDAGYLNRSQNRGDAELDRTSFAFIRQRCEQKGVKMHLSTQSATGRTDDASALQQAEMVNRAQRVVVYFPNENGLLRPNLTGFCYTGFSEYDDMGQDFPDDWFDFPTEQAYMFGAQNVGQYIRFYSPNVRGTKEQLIAESGGYAFDFRPNVPSESFPEFRSVMEFASDKNNLFRMSFLLNAKLVLRFKDAAAFAKWQETEHTFEIVPFGEDRGTVLHLRSTSVVTQSNTFNFIVYDFTLDSQISTIERDDIAQRSLAGFQVYVDAPLLVQTFVENGKVRGEPLECLITGFETEGAEWKKSKKRVDLRVVRAPDHITWEREKGFRVFDDWEVEETADKAAPYLALATRDTKTTGAGAWDGEHHAYEPEVCMDYGTKLVFGEKPVYWRVHKINITGEGGAPPDSYDRFAHYAGSIDHPGWDFETQGVTMNNAWTYDVLTEKQQKGCELGTKCHFYTIDDRIVEGQTNWAPWEIRQYNTFMQVGHIDPFFSRADASGVRTEYGKHEAIYISKENSVMDGNRTPQKCVLTAEELRFDDGQVTGSDTVLDGVKKELRLGVTIINGKDRILKFENSSTYLHADSMCLAGPTQGIKNLKFTVTGKVTANSMQSQNGSNIWGGKERSHFELFDNYITDGNTGQGGEANAASWTQEDLELDALTGRYSASANSTSDKGRQLASNGYRVEFSTRGVRLKYFDPNADDGNGAIKYLWKTWLQILEGGQTTPN